MYWPQWTTVLKQLLHLLFLIQILATLHTYNHEIRRERVSNELNLITRFIHLTKEGSLIRFGTWGQCRDKQHIWPPIVSRTCWYQINSAWKITTSALNCNWPSMMIMFSTGIQSCPQHEEHGIPLDEEVSMQALFQEGLGRWWAVCFVSTCFLAWSLLRGLCLLNHPPSY